MWWLTWQSEEEGGRRREVEINLRVRMLVGSKRDDMVIVKVIMPDILTLHLSDPDSHPGPIPFSIHRILARVQEDDKAITVATKIIL